MSEAEELEAYQRFVWSMSDEQFNEWYRQFYGMHSLTSVVVADEDSAEMIIEVGNDAG